MIVVGIDPGKKGCAVALSTDAPKGFGYLLDFDKAGHLDTAKLTRFLDLTRPSVIVCEKVMGRGGDGWGATQVFNFGFTCGEINAVIGTWAKKHHASIHYVPPQNWQKVIHEGVASSLAAKTRSMIAYERMFPHRPIPLTPKSKKTDDNIVDALLIATWGVLRVANRELQSWTLDIWGDK